MPIDGEGPRPEIEDSEVPGEVDMDDLRRRWGELYTEERMLEIANLVAEFAKALRGQFGEKVYDYKAWHIISGSGHVEGLEPQKEDFPGELSVAKFIEQLEKKFGEE